MVRSFSPALASGRSVFSLFSVLSLATLLLGIGACQPAVDGRPEARCYAECKQRVKSCSDDDCARGCKFILDRVIEREDNNVLTCMTSAKKCDDPSFAKCAASIGIHADGGPPLPKVRGDDSDEKGDLE